MSTHESHIDVGVVVRDIDACLPFYRDVLGLPVVREVKRDTSGMWELACGPCRIRLMAQDPAPEAANPLGGLRGATGLRFWSMEVEDIDAAVGRCQTAGATVSVPIVESRPGVRIAMVEDPEGNTIEFIERKL